MQGKRERMRNEKLFLKTLEYLKKECHFEVDIEARKDNRIRGCSVNLYNYTDGQYEDCYLIKYNSNKLKNKVETIMAVAHELGHISHNHFTFSEYSSLEEKEYQAEDFAMEVIKKFYPQYYYKALNILMSYANCYNKIYAKAFIRVARERVGGTVDKKR